MSQTAATPTLDVRDLGRLAYAPAFELQKQLNQAVIDDEAPDTLLLVEHNPVITVTPRKGAMDNLVASEDTLKRLGIEVAETNRGGDITYHGPGQLVAYPILRLARYGLNLSSYMRLLEQAVIDCVATWGVEGERDTGATGVWTLMTGTAADDETDLTPEARKLMLAKLCAMGVRVRRNTTMHGLALNVTTDLTHFQTIVPCGLVGRPVTSLRKVLGEAAPSMDRVKHELTAHLQSLLREAYERAAT